jgi:hypothetical protein
MSIDPQTKLLNTRIIEGLTSDNGSLRKEAEEGVESYLRMRLYEDGFARKIQPPVKVTPSDFDRQVDTDKFCIILDKEPSAPAAYSVPFGTLPIGHYIKGPRFRVMFDRIMSRRYTADVNTLLTYDMDIKQIIEDITLKNIMAEEDRKYLYLANYIVTQGNPANLDSAAGQNANSKNASIGICQNITLNGITRANLAKARQGLPSSNRHLNPELVLVNNITIWDVVAVLNRNEAGGNIAEEMLINGFGEKQLMGVKWTWTIKTDLVKNGVIYQFASPKYLGRFYTLDDVTLHTKTDAFMLQFFAYECLGAAIANDAAVVRVDFTGTNNFDWNTGLVV